MTNAEERSASVGAGVPRYTTERKGVTPLADDEWLGKYWMYEQ